jgi:heme oxygenase
MPERGQARIESLRTCLRENTSEAHDRLDGRVSALDMPDAREYTVFLRFQYAARAPIEDWLERRAPDLELPPMAPLIAQDLAALDASLPALAPFRCPAARGAIGIAWALAGSHLGNRALLVRLRKSGAEDRPTAFLADQTMREAWQALLPQLEAPADRLECAQAVTAALAVFDHFAHALDQTLDCAERVAA